MNCCKLTVTNENIGKVSVGVVRILPYQQLLFRATAQRTLHVGCFGDDRVLGTGSVEVVSERSLNLGGTIQWFVKKECCEDEYEWLSYCQTVLQKSFVGRFPL